MKLASRSYFAVALLALASFNAGCSKRASDAAPSSSDAPAMAPAAVLTPQARSQNDATPAIAAPTRHAMLEIHAQIEVEVADHARAKSLAMGLGDLARSRGGYVGESREDNGFIHMILRVPAAELRSARAEIADRGTILRDSEQAVDVTDAIADVDARLRSARIEEARLLKLLEEKSGSITDVLAAERALADVRTRVERLEADQRVAMGRVDLATLDVTVRHIPVILSEPTAGARIALAAHDGVTGLQAVTMTLLTTSLRAGPTLLMFAAIGAAILLAVRRLRKVARTG